MTLTLKGRVQAGRIVIDEPLDLPEGSDIELIVVAFETHATRRRGRSVVSMPSCERPREPGVGAQRSSSEA